MKKATTENRLEPDDGLILSPEFQEDLDQLSPEQRPLARAMMWVIANAAKRLRTQLH